MRVLLLALGATIALVLAAACGNSEEEPAALQPATATAAAPSKAVMPSATPSSEATLWRWVNVTVLIPEGFGIRATTDVIESGSEPVTVRQAVRIIRDTGRGSADYSWVLIDATTGDVAGENVLPEDRAVIDSVLAIVKVAPLDRVAAPWPYNGDVPVDAERLTFQDLSYINPHPSTGLQVYAGTGDPTGGFVGMRNGRSTIVVGHDANTDKLTVEMTYVYPEDEAVMQRWAETVKRCKIDILC